MALFLIRSKKKALAPNVLTGEPLEKLWGAGVGSS